jgi:hypothetical protein
MAMYEYLRPITRLWYARALGAGPLPPKPRDMPVVRSGDPDADRVLLLGNGPASGWGTLTYQLSLVGHLARALTGRTGTAWDADFVGEEQMNMASASAWLGNSDVASCRAAVLVLGTNDALRLTPVQDWERDLTALLDRLEREMQGRPVVVAGIVIPSRSSRFVGPFAGVADHHALVLNAATERIVAARPSVRFHPLPPAKVQPFDSSAAYQELGHKLAEVVHDALRTQHGTVPAATARHWEWDVAPQIVEITRAGGSEVLQRIADEARAEFGVAMATVSILDGDRLYYTINTDRLPNSVPRDLSHCKVVVDSDEPLVVPNSSRDERFRGNPLLGVTHAAFYAGFPLHAADGHTVGALCLLHGLPKSERSVPIAALERFALQAQDELQRLELAARRTAVEAESLV